ncbi:hypothetical protein DDZ18_10430 [Marinicauda salina]|uniref:DUF3617 family protein n=1 Tax=Marinicauda salina TaxID=2135793 RepID=A0A2U2BSZ2_9PROT|nr:hypothetical protein [Marinicauda salina]PWE17106.1 hypothetical protein DDZ18_10430 [Marinicauda salina]
MTRTGITMSALIAAFALAGCGDAGDAAPSSAELQSEGVEPEATQDEETGLSALDAAAQQACRAETDDALLAALPDGASFSSRGPDGVVVVGCDMADGRFVRRLRSTELSEEARIEFDLAVADHIRFGLRPGDDRSGTGAYRMRDGRFCAVQTDDAISQRLCAAAAEAAPDADAEE